jgi:hypothetical protein
VNDNRARLPSEPCDPARPDVRDARHSHARAHDSAWEFVVSLYYEHRAAHDSGCPLAGRVRAVFMQRQIARGIAAMLRARAARLGGGRG